MSNEFNKQKQDADKDREPENVKRGGFTAEELGEASSYNDTTEFAQQMRRGDETKGDPNDRDVVGDTTAANNDDNKPVPRHQRSTDDVADKNPETREN